MALSIALEIDTIILAFKGLEMPPVNNGKLQLLANIISLTGVATSIFRRPRFPQVWHVRSGNTIRGIEEDPCVFDDTHPDNCPVDLVLPIYHETHWAGWKDNINLVMGVIDERANWAPNPVGGIHVFVRRGQNVEFTLPEFKRIGIFICRFEEAIDELPPVRRALQDNDYISSNRFDPTLRKLKLPEVYTRIQGAVDMTELSALLNDRGENTSPSEAHKGYTDSKYFKVDFEPYFDRSGLGFFQHESSTSAKVVIGWAEFVIRFVDFAVNGSEDAVMTGGCRVEDLAHLVGLP